jgi:sugar lactone lactonase YvrE
VTTWQELPLGDHVLGESPRWDAGRRHLSWVDAVQGTVSWADYDGTQWGRVHRFGMRRVTAAVPSPRGWWVAAGDHVVEVSPVGVELGPEHLVSPDHPAVRTNDLAVDPVGGLVVSLFTEDRVTPLAGVVRLDPESGAQRQLVGKVVTGNGIGFSPDGARMYVVDTARGTLTAHPYDAGTRTAGPGAVLVREPGPGRLDGLTVEPSGDVWLAVWDRGEVRRYAPDGTLRSTVATPVARPSAVALAGPGLLVVTTARRDLARVDGCPAPDPEGRLYAYPLT